MLLALLLGGFNQELALGFHPVGGFVTRQPVALAAFGDEIGTQGNILDRDGDGITLDLGGLWGELLFRFGCNGNGGRGRCS